MERERLRFKRNFSLLKCKNDCIFGDEAIDKERLQYILRRQKAVGRLITDSTDRKKLEPMYCGSWNTGEMRASLLHQTLERLISMKNQPLQKLGCVCVRV